MAKKKQTIKIIPDYRDLPYSDVSDYADKEGLNIDTPENYKEAAQALFKKMQRKKEVEIKITGSGSPKELVKALQSIIKNIQSTPEVDLLEGQTWEDATLITETGEAY